MKKLNKNSQSKNTLSKMIMKKIHEEVCPEHGNPISCVNVYDEDRIRLGCARCKKVQNNSFLNLQQVLENPILIKTRDSKFYEEFYSLLKSFDHIQTIRTGLMTLLQDIKNKINQYCDRIQKIVVQKCENFSRDTSSEIEYIKKVQKQYREHFQMLVSEKMEKGTKEELQAVFGEFKIYSEDPTSALQQKIIVIKEETGDLPQINWEFLENLYNKVVDPALWNTNNMIIALTDPRAQIQIKAHENSLTCLLPEINNPLQDPKYLFSYTQQKIALLSSQTFNQSLSCSNHLDSLDHDSLDASLIQKNGNLSGLNQEILYEIQTAHDDYYELSEYRILGISYEKLSLFSYAFDRLIKIKEYEITGCTQVLSFSDCLILIANSKLIRLWLQDGAQDVLGLGFQKINYIKESHQYFQCTDANNKSLIKSVNHNLTSAQLN